MENHKRELYMPEYLLVICLSDLQESQEMDLSKRKLTLLLGTQFSTYVGKMNC